MQNETAAAYCIKSERMLLSRCVLLMIKICLQEYKNEKMKDLDFTKAYEEVQREMNVIRAIIEARTSQNLTQKELSIRTGSDQSEISKLENGTRNPSIILLQRLADGLKMVLDISYRPKEPVKKA